MGVGVRVPSGVNVAVAVFVFVDEGMRVALGRGVIVGVAVGGGKSWFATGSPNMAEATLNENKTSANASHCQPASTCARRVR